MIAEEEGKGGSCCCVELCLYSIRGVRLAESQQTGGDEYAGLHLGNFVGAMTILVEWL